MLGEDTISDLIQVQITQILSLCHHGRLQTKESLELPVTNFFLEILWRQRAHETLKGEWGQPCECLAPSYDSTTKTSTFWTFMQSCKTFSNSQFLINDVLPKISVHLSLKRCSVFPLVSAQILPLVHWPIFWTPSGIGCRLWFHAAPANLYPHQKRTVLGWNVHNIKKKTKKHRRVQTIWHESQSRKSWEVHLINEWKTCLVDFIFMPSPIDFYGAQILLWQTLRRCFLKTFIPKENQPWRPASVITERRKRNFQNFQLKVQSRSSVPVLAESCCSSHVGLLGDTPELKAQSNTAFMSRD